MTDGEGSGAELDEQEVTDECAMLIHADHIHKFPDLKGQKPLGTLFISKHESFFQINNHIISLKIIKICYNWH